jgi:hypothetical protein
MDKWWTEGVDKRGGVDILKKCVNEVGLRKSYYYLDLEPS